MLKSSSGIGEEHSYFGGAAAPVLAFANYLSSCCSSETQP